MDKMLTAAASLTEDNSLVQVTYEGPVMILKTTGPNGFVERYKLGEIPASTSSLVRYYRTEALKQLSLDNLTKDLTRCADLMFLAYNGVAGTGAMAASVSNRQKEFGNLCTECVATMTVFKDKSRDILDNIVTAYQLLLDPKEPDETEAIAVLAECGEYAKTMSAKCEKLAAGFAKLSTETTKDCTAAELAIGEQIKKVAGIEKLKAEMQATLNEQTVIAAKLKDLITELTKEITDAKSEEESESSRAFTMGIVGAIAGAVGTAAGAAIAMKTDPLGVRGLVESQKALHKDNDPSVKLAQEKVKEDEKKVEDAKVKEAAAQEKVTKAETKKTTAEKKVADATTTKKAKEAKTEAADTPKEEKTKLRAEVEVLETEIKTQNKAVEDSEVEIETAKKELTTAQSVIKGIAAGLQSAREDMNKMAAVAEKRYESAKALRVQLLAQKRKEQDAERTALGQIAKMTAALKSQVKEQEVEVATQSALEMAKWAFDNIYKILNDAKTFWDNMAAFCTKLADSKLGKDIERRAKRWTRPERIAYFQEESFLKPAIRYMANWKAMEVVAAEYVQKSSDVRKVVMDNIAKSPTVAEARAQLESLKTKIQRELKADEAVADEHIAEIKKLEAQFDTF